MSLTGAELIRQGPAMLFAWVLLERIGIPLPAAPALLTAGALADRGRMSLPLVIATATAASILADVLWYEVGRRAGRRVLSFLCRISLEPDSCVRRTESQFARHGARSLVVAKFVPWLAVTAAPLAGIVRMPYLRFLLYDAIGSLIWAGGFILVGYAFSEQLEWLVAAMARMGSWVWIALALIAAYIFLKWWNRRRFTRSHRVERISPAELKRKLEAGEEVVVLDLRSSGDVAADPETIPGAVRIDREDLDEHHEQIPRGREVILFCT